MQNGKVVEPLLPAFTNPGTLRRMMLEHKLQRLQSYKQRKSGQIDILNPQKRYLKPQQQIKQDVSVLKVYQDQQQQENTLQKQQILQNSKKLQQNMDLFRKDVDNESNAESEKEQYYYQISFKKAQQKESCTDQLIYQQLKKALTQK